MRGATMTATKRLTWDEIVLKYPMQWVGLTDVEWEPDNRATIKSAVVSYAGLPRKDVVGMMHKTRGEVVARFTEPNKLPFLAIMM